MHLARGRFVIEDLQIDGMRPGEPPWLVAKRIDVSLTWRALFGREVLLDTIEMTDWRMVVESFPDGRQTFPRRDRSAARAPRTGPALVVTTLQYVHAYRGELVLNDYGSDWSMVAPEPRRHRVEARSSIAAQARFNGGTITDPEVRADVGRHDARRSSSTAASCCSIGSTSMTDGAVSHDDGRRRHGEVAGADSTR